MVDIFPSARLGNALLAAAENMNRLFENVLIPSRSQMTMTLPLQPIVVKIKETDDSYKVMYDVPGLTKDELKVTVADGVLRVRGERKVEDEVEEKEDED